MKMMARRDFMKAAIGGAALLAASPAVAVAPEKTGKKIRTAFIGVGDRGTGLLNMLFEFPDVEVSAICDINEVVLNRAIDLVEKARGNTPASYSHDEYDYRNMLKRDDFDLVIIATSIKWHGIMAIDAMNAGKHVASEVPACRSLDECRGMVKAKEANKVRYMMLENYCFTEPALAVLNMARKDVFGSTYYAECGYLHEYKAGHYTPDGGINWRGELVTKTHGNHYPTHSGGPVFKWMGINDGDRLNKLTCYSTPDETAREYYTKRFGEEAASKMKWTLGEMTTCLMGTANGRVIKMDLDIQSNRPHSFYYLLQGTKGIYDSRFGISLVDPTQDLSRHPHFTWEDPQQYLDKYNHPAWVKYGKEAMLAGHGGGDYLELQELVHSMREEREPWIDVYDAAAWSAIYECSRLSLDQSNATVEIPDFTNGRWTTNTWRETRLLIG